MLKRLLKLRLLLVNFTLLISNQALFSQTVTCDSIYTDQSFTEWGTSKKTINRYNSDGSLSFTEQYKFDDVTRTWLGESKYETTYKEGATSYTSNTILYNPTHNWENPYRKISVEIEDRVTTTTVYSWGKASKSWIAPTTSKSKSETENGSSEYPDMTIFYNWDDIARDWVKYSKSNYTYDTKGNLTLSESFLWDNALEIWKPQSKFILKYDSYNNNVRQEFYSVNPATNELEFSKKTDYENIYEKDKLASVTVTDYNKQMKLTAYYKYVYLYDSNNNLIRKNSFSKQDTKNEWTLDTKETYFSKDVDQTFVSISPSNYGIEKGGILRIPALEKPVASSRVWKYKRKDEAVYSNFSPPQTSPILSATFTESGDYEIICESTINGKNYTSNPATIKIATVSISPIETQEIQVDNYGTALTVTEIPRAESRNWYYSKVSGGPYTKLMRYEINYTPEFSEPGIYYLICGSTWKNFNVSSNEVIIKVSGVKLSSSKTQLLKINETGKKLSAIEFPVPTQREWKYKTSSTGIWKSFDKKITSDSYTPSFSNVGEYYVACFSVFETETKMSDIVRIQVIEDNRIAPISEQTIDTSTEGEELHVTENPIADSRTWLYSKEGSFGLETISNPSRNYTPKFTEPGSYYVTCMSLYEHEHIMSNSVKINVKGNSISPMDKQIILVNKKGNILNVLESETASSREWKYKAASENTWQSFNLAQTETSLTPSFSETGTYQIACFSVINSKTYMSNEIEIEIIEGNSITPSNNQTVDINTNGNLLSVSETPSADYRYWHISKISGEYGYKTNTYENTTTFQPHFEESGTYYIVCQSEWGNTKINSNEVVITVNGYGETKLQNSISPTTDQTIDIESEGIQLTVNESTTANSRKWYYSSKQGKDYENSLSETEENYTPKFSTPGVYYVVCKSKLDSLNVTSNEVKVTVKGNKLSSPWSQYIAVGYNGKGISILEHPVASSREWKYKLSSNGEWKSFVPAQTSIAYVPNFDTEGEYYVACFSQIDGKTYESNHLKIRVSGNSVSPTESQNISPNSDGNTLTVDEAHYSRKKEWYCSKTLGKDYFNYLGEGKTFTPNISEAGVYYIVCKSTWSSGSVFSNAVQVNVIGNNISPISDQLIQPNSNGSTLQVSEYPTASSREWKYRTESGSWTSFSPTRNSENYSPNFTEAGTYYVACFSEINGNTSISNEVQITVAENSITPVAEQAIAVNTNGAQLSVLETIPADTRGWYYSTQQGSDYNNFLGESSTFTPNFPEVGEYYIVCKSTWGNSTTTSNEVRIAVAGSSISPADKQTIAIGANGTTINVSEYPAATSREWKYKTGSGTWTSFGATETTENYTPNFTEPGTYYVACFSEINGSIFTSNEIQIVVAKNSIAPTANQTIPVNTDGTNLTVQETVPANSRAWYYSTQQGGDYDKLLGEETTFIPNFPQVGEYYVVCKSTWGNSTATSNEVYIAVAGNSINPVNEQTIASGANGSEISVTEYPTATSREWKYRTESDTWTSFSTAETTDNYTPNFTESGIYYIACFSEINGSTFTSNEIQVVVAENSIAPTANQTIPVNTDGTSLTVQETVPADSRAWYYSTQQGGDYDTIFGEGTSFTPNFSEVGEYYVVCKSTWGNSTATSNEVHIVVSGNSISPAEEQTVAKGINGIEINVSEYPAATTREWKYRTATGTWTSFTTTQTAESYTPFFAESGIYYVACFSEINGNTFTSNDIRLIISENSIAPTANQTIPVNTNGTRITVQETIPADSRAWYYSTQQGGDYDKLLGEGTALTPNFSEVGEYYVVCKSTWGNSTTTSNEVYIAVAGNSINPIDKQTVAKGSNGTKINVTEYPTATAREWKYRTTTGTWTSFAIAQTEEYYTPNFTESGIYYVACFSEINGNTFVSDEIRVVVAENSIAPVANQTISVNTDGTSLTVKETVPADSRAWYFSTQQGTDYDYYLGNGLSVIPNFTEAGEYYVVCKSTWNNSTSISNEIHIIVTKATSVNSLKSAGIKLFPNPSDGEFTIEHPLGIKEIKIYTLDGLLSYHKTNVSSFEKTEVKLKSKGLHLLLIRTNKDEIFIDKILINK